MEKLFIGTDASTIPFSVEPLESRSNILKSLHREFLASLEQEFYVNNEELINFNEFPFSITGITPMEHIYILFEMVKVSCIFVVIENELKGMITRGTLLMKLKVN
jgi:hypothetical protein